jgi:asparagine synthase (glutamine-hydrolysing)
VTERLTSGDARALVPGIGRVLDEPFADASFLPSLLLCQAARRHVTVALSGDGGDEVFLGYDRYRWLAKVLGATEHVPASLRRTAATMLARAPHYRASMLGRAMGWKRSEEAYPWIFIGWNAAWAESLLGHPIHFDRHPLMKFARQARNLPPVRAAGYADLRLYLPDDILTKMDRASMWHSLEVRVPLLDHRIVQWSLGLPSWIQGAPEEPKRLLRLLLARHLPERLFRRPKAGFAVPLHRWLRGSLRPLLEEALSPSELRRHGLFEARAVRQTMDRHFSGRWNHERQLWALLAFELWYAENHR